MMPSLFASTSYINTLFFFNRSFQIFIFLACWEIFFGPIPTNPIPMWSPPQCKGRGGSWRSITEWRNREAAAKWQTKLYRKSLIQNQPFDSFSTLIFLWRTIKTRTLLFSFCLLHFKSLSFCSSSIFFYLCHLSAPNHPWETVAFLVQSLTFKEVKARGESCLLLLHF